MKFNTNKLFNLITVLLVAFVAWQYFNPPAGISVHQAQALVQQGGLLLDVREPDEFAEGHAPMAHLIPLGEVAQRLPELAAYKNQPVAVICRSGRRSAKAVTLLQNEGFTQVSNVSGGMTAWQAAGLPVVK